MENEKIMQDLADMTKVFENKKLDLIVKNVKMTFGNNVLKRSHEPGMSMTMLRDYIIDLIYQE